MRHGVPTHHLFSSMLDFSLLEASTLCVASVNPLSDTHPHLQIYIYIYIYYFFNNILNVPDNLRSFYTNVLLKKL